MSFARGCPWSELLLICLKKNESDVDAGCGGVDSEEEESLDDGLMENSSESLETIIAFCCHQLVTHFET